MENNNRPFFDPYSTVNNQVSQNSRKSKSGTIVTRHFQIS